MPSTKKDDVFPAPPSPIPVHRFPKKGSTCTVTTASTSRSGEGEDDSDGTITWTEAEEKKLVRKLDWCFLPTVWLMALMSWMDRSSIGNAQLAGMGLDLELSDDQYSMVIVVFYFGYVTCGPLSNLILSRTRPRLYLPILVGCWGLLTLSMAFVTNYTNLLMLRFSVGVFESGLSPATIFLISCWYRPDEQGKRISATLSAALLGGAFGGIISGSAAAWLEGVNHIRGWKWLFGIEGVFTMVWATISYWLMVDFPGSESTAKRFGERGRQIAVGRVKKEGVLLGRLDGDGSLTAAVERLGKAKSIRVALSDWRVWTITVGVGLLGCSTVLAYFYPILIFEMGFESITQTQFMTIPIWIMAVISAVLVGYLADSFPLRRSLMMGACMGSAAVFSSLVCVIQSPHARYGLLFFMAGGVWSSIALYLSLLAVTFSDMHPEARAFALALPGAVGNLGNVYGAYLFPGSDIPEYFMGFGVIAGTLGAGAVLFFVFHLLLRKRRLLGVDE
ncbi:vitamin H transporter [Rhypophila decipiens]